MCVTIHYTHLASLSNKKKIIVSLDWKANAKSGKIRKVESRCHLSILKSPLDNVDFLRDASVIVPRLNAQTRSQMQSDRNNNSNETLARGEEEEEFKVHSTSISVCRRHFRANGREGGGEEEERCSSPRRYLEFHASCALRPMDSFSPEKMVPGI